MPSDQSSKDDFPRPQIIYEPSVFVREAMIKKWPNLHKVIASGDELAAAYEGIRKTSFWREDPRLRDISRETADEVLDLYNHVVEDGEHIEEFLTNPREVANKLGRRLSDDAVAVIGQPTRASAPRWRPSSSQWASSWASPSSPSRLTSPLAAPARR